MKYEIKNFYEQIIRFKNAKFIFNGIPFIYINIYFYKTRKFKFLEVTYKICFYFYKKGKKRKKKGKLSSSYEFL